MDFLTVLIFVCIPFALFAAFCTALVWSYKAAKGVFGKVAAKSASTAKKPDVAAKPASHSGATELESRTIAGDWFSSPDVTDLDTPAFLRKQAA